MTREDTVRSGSCLCGSIKYEITGNPVSFRVCHCTNCRKSTGSAFMSNGVFLREQLCFVGGQDKLVTYRDTNTASGVALNRQFCAECGSNVLLFTDHPEHGKKSVIVALGTLDQEFSWLPMKELFGEEKRHWVSGIAVEPKHKL